MWKDKKVMEDLYVTQGLSQKRIAEAMGCTETTVWKWLRRHGIQSRPSGSEFKHGCNNKGYAWRRSGGRRRVLIHREVAAQVLGRPLSSAEVVHHCNEVKTDNGPENLWVFPNQSAHRKFHLRGEVHPNTIKLTEVHDVVV
jgi:transcriptional regulator with XRE-family HTH domain